MTSLFTNHPREHVARRILGISAWSNIVLLILGSILAFIAGFANGSGVPSRTWNVILYTQLALFSISMLSVWLSAIWHVVVNPGRSQGHRLVLTIVLAFTNFLGCLAYYFLYVVWRKDSGTQKLLN